MTPVEQLASVASALLARISPSPATFMRALRAGVMRGGCVAPGTRRTPKRGLAGSKAMLALIIMRATMPSGASV